MRFTQGKREVISRVPIMIFAGKRHISEEAVCVTERDEAGDYSLLRQLAKQSAQPRCIQDNPMGRAKQRENDGVLVAVS